MLRAELTQLPLHPHTPRPAVEDLYNKYLQMSRLLHIARLPMSYIDHRPNHNQSQYLHHPLVLDRGHYPEIDHNRYSIWGPSRGGSQDQILLECPRRQLETKFQGKGGQVL